MPDEGVWIKRGVGNGLPYGLPYGPSYGLTVVNTVKTPLSIAVDLCKQRAPSNDLSYLRLSSVLLKGEKHLSSQSKWRSY